MTLEAGSCARVVEPVADEDDDAALGRLRPSRSEGALTAASAASKMAVRLSASESIWKALRARAQVAREGLHQLGALAELHDGDARARAEV
jgi:hypothetical protein